MFIVLAVFAIGAFYQFASLRKWNRADIPGPEVLSTSDTQGQEEGLSNGASVAEDSKENGNIQETTTQSTSATSPTALLSTASADPQIIKIEQTTLISTSASASAAASPGSVASSQSQSQHPESVLSTSTTSRTSTSTTSTTNTFEPVKTKAFGLNGQGRHEVPPPLSGEPIRWSRLPEHFPIPSESIIPLPTARPKSIPKIQFSFKDESSAAKIQREDQQKEVKDAFKHAWNGYREHAWLHDELKPESGGYRDPFCGWSATLVDALDTLWIMGLEEEFSEAIEALSQIDFTTSPRSDIPLFETTIRYLGGLLSAHDVSNGKYPIIVKKAVELADVLMGAFDTPNRMPIMYYFWKPTFASNPHRAGTRAVLAELGSLSMEFTRLAQITGEHKYYDAVARITTELEIFQSETKIPGLWPKFIDTSGCKKPEISNQVPENSPNQIPVGPKPGEPDLSAPHTGRQRQKSRVEDWPERTVPEVGTVPPAPPASDGQQLSRRQLDMEPPVDPSKDGEGAAAKHPPGPSAAVHEVPAEKIDCQPQGLTSPPSVVMEHFTFGGAADSTYEYLPKQYLLLGGQVPQYRKMYEAAIDAANENLLFRPMIPDNDREILVVGSADVREGWRQDPEKFNLIPDQSHLLCFAGGMWGIGSRIFEREKDMEIAEKLTDACVWAYESTKTGIMPESMAMMPCPSRINCQWNQTAWYEALDPFRESREESQRMMKETELKQQQQAQREAELAETQKAPSEPVEAAAEQGQQSAEIPTSGPIARRQIIASEPGQSSETSSSAGDTTLSGKPSVVSEQPSAPSYNMYPTHEEYVKGRIEREGLPIGVPVVQSKDYILRPEAIESVFIMYRMTGDEKWRKKGWQMFQSIQKETVSEFGNSAIIDVLRPGWEYNQKDQMESFWLAETLKYFYLLFSSPNDVSLDDYVL